eukprot:3675462-Pyramimonas_sp.AAC.1
MFGLLGAPLGNSFGHLEQSRGGLGASWGIFGAMLRHRALSWATLEAILGSLRPYWGRLGPSWPF